MTAIASPRLAIIAAGEMGAAVGKKLTSAGCTVYTNLDGRSEATRRRAKEAGMLDASLDDIVVEADWILSILPPLAAMSFAEKIREVAVSRGKRTSLKPLVFVDCNAVSPDTVKRIAGVFVGTAIKFIDASIVGIPPREGYDPTIYASAAAEDRNELDAFVALSMYGLKTSPLTGEDVGVGGASALKMLYSTIEKGTIGLWTTMILAAHASSPAIAETLVDSMSTSHPEQLDQIIMTVPSMISKAYRWVGEMDEVGEFVGGEEGDIYRGIARAYKRVERSLDGDQADIKVLNKFVEDAKRARER